jgi:hypothetical protein
VQPKIQKKKRKEEEAMDPYPGATHPPPALVPPIPDPLPPRPPRSSTCVLTNDHRSTLPALLLLPTFSRLNFRDAMDPVGGRCGTPWNRSPAGIGGRCGTPWNRRQGSGTLERESIDLDSPPPRPCPCCSGRKGMEGAGLGSLSASSTTACPRRG